MCVVRLYVLVVELCCYLANYMRKNEFVKKRRYAVIKSYHVDIFVHGFHGPFVNMEQQRILPRRVNVTYY